MSIQITSTTDTAEAVSAAMGTTATPDPVKEAPSAPESQETPEQKQPSESETEETEVKEESSDESEDADSMDEADKSDEDALKEKPKKKSGFQRRIDKLNARYADKEREAEYWRQEALKKAATEPGQKAAPEAPKSNEGKPNPDDFNTHAEYVEALTDWKTEKKFKEQEQKAERARIEAELERSNRSHAERLEAFKAKTDDFDEMLENLADVPRSVAVEQIIVSSENGPELLYELAKNPKEAKRIALLPPLAAAREIGKLESKLFKASEENKVESKKITKAPAPPSPVGSKSSASSKSPDQMSYQEFKKWREAQLMKRK